MACFLKNILQPHLQFDMFFQHSEGHTAWWSEGYSEKVASIFFFQNPFLWAMGQKNMNCGKIFLPYGITPLSLLKSPIFTMKKKLKYFFVNNKILRHIKLFCSIRHYMGILDMEFKRIFEATFFRVVFTPSRCGQ